MIRDWQGDRIAKRLREEVGVREDVGNFVFWFAFLDPGRDLEYALDLLEKADDPEFKKAINIVLEEVVK